MSYLKRSIAGSNVKISFFVERGSWQLWDLWKIYNSDAG